MVNPEIRKEIEDKLHEILNTWSRHDYDHVEKMAGYFDEGFSGFGTELNEIWRSKQDMVDQQVRDHQQTPGGFSYQIRDFQIYETSSSSICICSFQMDMAFNLGESELHLKDYRHSVVFQKRKGEWLSIHWHASKSGKNLDAEVFPGVTGPRKYDEVSILFTDFEGFTTAVPTIPPDQLVNELNDIFSTFDQISDDYGIMKIKTIGDAYMAVAGLNINNNHAKSCILAAKKMISYLKERNETAPWKWHLRAGIHSGPVVGGFIGIDETNFDVWGDTVNTASHMERSGAPGKINISAYTYHIVQNNISCTYRGKVKAKGKGPIDMYFVND